MTNPAEIIEELHRLRDLAKRLLDPRDLGRNAHREIRRAAAAALHGAEPRPDPHPKEPIR